MTTQPSIKRSGLAGPGRILATTIALCATVTLLVSAAAQAPKLIVLLVVDQFRGDYVEKFQSQWTGGLHRLLTEGAYFRLADYPYANTVTCAGHATISTGSWPSTHGMIANSWYDRATKQTVACADDTAATIVSYGDSLTGKGEGPGNLRVPTLGDELRAQRDPRAKVAAFSLKARSAVTLAGRRADAIAWFDDRGEWVSSSVYDPAPVPALAEFIAKNPVKADLDRVWDRALPKDRYLFEAPAVGISGGKNMTADFPHVLKNEGVLPVSVFFDHWQSSPWADEYLAKMGLDSVARLGMGRGNGTDLLAISFSTLDKVGHDYGPNSHEIQDVLIRLDRTLGAFFDELDRTVGHDAYVVALSADHGVAPVPERARPQGLDAGRVSAVALTSAVDRALDAALPPASVAATHVAAIVDTNVYLAPGFWTLARQPTTMRLIRESLGRVPGVMRVYTRDEIEANQFADDPIGRRLAHSFDAERSADIFIVLKPYWMTSGSGTTHGTPFGYDTRVPIFLMGKGIGAGEFLEPASPADIAPTLAFLAGITLPSAQGRVLSEALTAKR